MQRRFGPKLPMRFSLTMDEWTSLGPRRFANINVHCHENIYNLGMYACHGSMPADKCRELIQRALQEFGHLPSDIVGITTDGAETMKAMGRQL